MHIFLELCLKCHAFIINLNNFTLSCCTKSTIWTFQRESDELEWQEQLAREEEMELCYLARFISPDYAMQHAQLFNQPVENWDLDILDNPLLNINKKLVG